MKNPRHVEGFAREAGRESKTIAAKERLMINFSAYIRWGPHVEDDNTRPQGAQDNDGVSPLRIKRDVIAWSDETTEDQLEAD